MANVVDYLYYYAPHLILAGVVLLISIWTYKKRAGQKHHLKRIALNLGLKYSDMLVEPTDAVGELEPIEPKVSERANRLAEMVETVSGWRMEGKYEGVTVRIYSTKRNGTERKQTESTCMSALAKWEPYCSLMIARTNILDKLGTSVLKMQDIQTTNEELNELVVIKGLPEHFVKKILDDSAFQHELLELFRLDGMIHVDQKGAHFRRRGTMVDEPMYRRILDHLTRTASALERAAKS